MTKSTMLQGKFVLSSSPYSSASDFCHMLRCTDASIGGRVFTFTAFRFEFPCVTLVLWTYGTYWPATVLGFDEEASLFDVCFADRKKTRVARSKILRLQDPDFYTCKVKPPLSLLIHLRAKIYTDATLLLDHFYRRNRWVIRKLSSISKPFSFSFELPPPHFTRSSSTRTDHRRNGIRSSSATRRQG